MSIESHLKGLTGDMPPGMTESIALGTGLADGYDYYESAIGQVVVAFNTEGVSSVDMGGDFEQRHMERFGRRLIRAEPPRAWSGHIPEAIERGTPGRLPIDLRSVTGFQRDVLVTTATIPKGEVRPYGWVAREVHRPKAVRAVGSAVARNPIPLIIPCHRVVRSDGHLGNYSLGGPHNKVELLEHEGAGPRWLEELAGHHVRLRADPATGVYCLPTCHVVRKATAESVIDFPGSGQALAAGYRPCEVCRPIG
jgi:O-6-methylguanine DNA methyltransferase